MASVIEVKNIRKKYGDFTAVDGISLTIQQGEIFGIVGPNGAGKSTTVETMMGLRKPDSGSVTVLGMDPIAQRSAVAERIGIQLQQAALPQRIRVEEALELFATFYQRTIPYGPLLEQWGLNDKRNTYFRDLSGGQKQRLFIALALLNDPEIVFLDELTTGLDPQARRSTWELVASIREQGRTVVMVTHFMDEAQELCDHIAIIDHGQVIATDTPSGLIAALDSNARVLFRANGDTPLDELKQLPGITDVRRRGEDVVVSGQSEGLVPAVISTLEKHHISFKNLRTEQADLEDVFLSLTGRELRD